VSCELSLAWLERLELFKRYFAVALRLKKKKKEMMTSLPTTPH